MELTPVSDEEPWDAIEFDHIRRAPDRGRVDDTPDHGSDPNVRHNDSITLRLGEENGIG